MLEYSQNFNTDTELDFKLTEKRKTNKAPKLNSVTEMKKEWSFEKNKKGEYVITGYKGEKLEITVPDNINDIPVVAIGDCAFSPEQKRIRSDVAEKRKKLVSITIPEGIETLGEYAFHKCESLKNVNLPSSLKDIGRVSEYNYFEHCSLLGKCDSLENIVVADGNSHIRMDEKVLICNKKIFFALNSLEGTYKIPEGTVYINTGAFADCIRLTGIEICDGMKMIGRSAFENCFSLKEVIFPKYLPIDTIHQDTFRGCGNLASITLPNGLISIYDTAFRNCTNLTNVTLPDSIHSIGYHAFSWPKKLTFHAPAGSYAERYANENGITLVTE